MFDFISEISYQAVGHDRHTNTPHNDNSIEIIQTMSSGGYFLIRNQLLMIEPGAIFLINAIEPHFSNPSEPDKYMRNKIIINRNYFDELSKFLDLDMYKDNYIYKNGGSVFYFDPSSPTTIKIKDLIKDSYNLYRNGNKDKLSESKVKINIMQIFIELFSDIKQVQIQDDSVNSKIPSLIINYINDTIANNRDFSVNIMCDELHISRSYASHIFKRVTGTSIIKYINNLKFGEAKNLLVNSNMNIKDISNHLNFNSFTVFSKTFKSYTGLTPSQYRNTNSRHKT